MTRLFLITLLALSSEPVYAEWVAVSKNDEQGMTIYVDPDTIRHNGDMVKMWHLFDMKTAKPYRGDSLLSIKVQSEYDCSEERMRQLAASHHSGNMGRGTVVYLNLDQGKWGPIPPDTVRKTLWTFACAKK